MNLITHKEGATLFQSIRTTKFKSMRIQLRFFSELSPKDATARTLMLAMLSAKNEVYPTRRELLRKLETLFDTRVYGRTVKLGKKHVAQIDMQFVNPKYTDIPDTFMNEVINHLSTTLNRPLFDETSLKEEKRFLDDHFASEYANKDIYASRRYQTLLFKDHPYRIPANGEREYVSAITLEDIEEAYRSMLRDPLVVSVVGDGDEPLENEVKTRFKSQGTGTLEAFLVRQKFPVREDVHETLKLSQDRLFMTLESDTYYTDKDVWGMRVLNTLFGGASESMLFESVREKHGLAYQVASSYQPFTSLITAMAGVSHENVEKAKELIKEELEKIKNGAFTDDDLDIAKKNLAQSIKKSYDSENSLAIKAFVSELFDVPLEKDDVLKLLDDVKREDIKRLASTLRWVFTYALGGTSHA
ncbi:MAG: EF-P 5-aminopentanol modification-associated protein YfmF [Bacillota bacterium]